MYFYKFEIGPTFDRLADMQRRADEVSERISKAAKGCGFEEYAKPIFALAGFFAAKFDKYPGKDWLETPYPKLFRPNLNTKKGKALSKKLQRCGMVLQSEFRQILGITGDFGFPGYCLVNEIFYIKSETKVNLPDAIEITATEFETHFNSI